MGSRRDSGINPRLPNYFMPVEAEALDQLWMRQAIALARRAAAMGEVPVGAVLIREGQVLGEGWNCPIGTHDPSAHAEIRALRDAGARVGNYRFPGATLYVTLEPCPMCASALVHARVARVVYGALDPKGGACGSVFALLPPDQRFNHRLTCQGEVLAEECGALLRHFFRQRRGRSNQRREECQSDQPVVSERFFKDYSEVDSPQVNP